MSGWILIYFPDLTVPQLISIDVVFLLKNYCNVIEHMFLVFNVQVLFNCCYEYVISVGTWRGVYTSGVVACVPRHVTLVSFLVPVEDSVFGLDGSEYPIRFWMVVSGLLRPLLCLDQENWGFQQIVDLVDDDRVYLNVIVFDFSFDRTLSSDLDH